MSTIEIVQKHVPNWVVLLICASRRIHSIFMLRLFNDGIAMLVFYVSVLLLTRGKYLLANIGLSLAVSVKMNILLFAPSWLIILWHGLGFWASMPYLALCAAIQVRTHLLFLSSLCLFSSDELITLCLGGVGSAVLDDASGGIFARLIRFRSRVLLQVDRQLEISGRRVLCVETVGTDSAFHSYDFAVHLFALFRLRVRLSFSLLCVSIGS
jgi:hypothetical protein